MVRSPAPAAVEKIAEADDRANNYAEVVANHDALYGLVSLLKGRARVIWRGGGGAWRRRQRRAPHLPALTNDEMQRVVLSIVRREYPVLKTIPAIACELFENPNDLTGGMVLARAVHRLAEEELVHSDGFLVLPKRPALHLKRLRTGDGPRWAQRR